MQALSRQEFLQSSVGIEARRELRSMVTSAVYSTADAYDSTVGRQKSFVDRHINYLVKHPSIDPVTYLGNLRIMTKVSR